MTDNSSDDAAAPPSKPDGIGPFTRRHLLSGAAAVLATGAILVVLTAPLTGGTRATEPPRPGSSFYLIGPEVGAFDIGSRAPGLTSADGGTLSDVDGRIVTSDDLDGRPLWVFFFATWCPPCQQETPDIQRVWEGRGDDVVILGIDVQEPRELVDQYRRSYGLTYRIVVDATAAVMQRWNIFGLPTHYFIDRDGVIRARQLGPLPLAEMEDRIDLIAGAPQ